MNVSPPRFDSGARALITGASGFIGTALMRRLLREGVTVCAITRSAPPTDAMSVEWRRCDMEDGAALHRVLRDVRPDFVFHLASHVSGDRSLAAIAPTFRSNLLSTVNLLTTAADLGCRRLVLTGSMEEPSPSLQWTTPSSPYAAAKSAASAYGRLFHLLYATPVVLLRLFMVYGPGQRDTHKLIPYTILSLLNGSAPKVASGRRLIDWVYIDDVVDAYVRAALCADGAGHTFDIASGERVTVRSVIERLVALVNPAIVPQYGAIPERAAEQEPVADLAPAVARLQWCAQVPLDQGLARTVAWYRARRDVSAATAVT